MMACSFSRTVTLLPVTSPQVQAASHSCLLYTSEVNPLDTIVGQTGSHFKEKVEELTGGSVVVDVQACGVLGSENDVLDLSLIHI